MFHHRPIMLFQHYRQNPPIMPTIMLNHMIYVYAQSMPCHMFPDVKIEVFNACNDHGLLVTNKHLGPPQSTRTVWPCTKVEIWESNRHIASLQTLGIYKPHPLSHLLLHCHFQMILSNLLWGTSCNGEKYFIMLEVTTLPFLFRSAILTTHVPYATCNNHMNDVYAWLQLGGVSMRFRRFKQIPQMPWLHAWLTQWAMQKEWICIFCRLSKVN